MKLFRKIIKIAKGNVARVAKKDPENKSVELTKDRDARCRPFVPLVLRYIADYPELMSNIGSDGVTQEKMDEFYKKMCKDIFPSFRDQGLKMNDIDYIFKMALQPVDLLKQAATYTVDEKYSKANEYLWGVEDVDLFLDLDKLEAIEKEAFNESKAVEK